MTNTTDKETSIAEVRPWVGTNISTGQFKLMKDVRLVDFSRDKETRLSSLFGQLTADKIEKYIWAEMNYSFSNPIQVNDKSADYAPTQIIAEFFKNNGFDGIAYKSGLGPGFNLALYEPNAAEQLNGFLFSIDEVSYKFSENGQSYSLVKKNQK